MNISQPKLRSEKLDNDDDDDDDDNNKKKKKKRRRRMQSTRHRSDRKMVHPHTPKPLCEDRDLSVLRHQGLHSLRESRQNIDLTIKNKKENVTF